MGLAPQEAAAIIKLVDADNIINLDKIIKFKRYKRFNESVTEVLVTHLAFKGAEMERGKG